MKKVCKIYVGKLAKIFGNYGYFVTTHFNFHTRPRYCFINGTSEHEYFAYSNINQQIFFTGVLYYRYLMIYMVKFCRLFHDYMPKASNIFSISLQFDTMLSKLDAMLVKLDTMMSKLDTMLIKLDTMMSKLDTMMSKLDTMLIKFDTMFSKFDAILIKFDTMFSKPNTIMLKSYLK
jgi:hypothetical protein